MLTSVNQIIEALGGTTETAKIAGVTPAAVSNWRTRKRIPSDKYLQLSAALERAGKEAKTKAFGFRTGAAA